jgi:beta-lactamase superfamily II metal-dependent hydrolase
MTLHLVVLQAQHGDCLVLERRRGARVRRYLIDGGPEDTWALHLEPYLRTIASTGGQLDAIMLSHVHNDHIVGLLDLLAEVRRRRDTGEAPLLPIGGLWHNSFSLVPADDADERGDDAVGSRVTSVLAAAAASTSASGLAAPRAAAAIQGYSEGDSLRRAAIALGLPLNEPFPGREILAETAPQIEADGLRLRFVGPSRKTLADLREEWLAWLRAHAQDVLDGDPRAAAAADRSVPNLSSVSVLATWGRRSALLTGDGLGTDILRNLEDLAIVPPGGSLHVDLLKLPHHGSNRNVNRRFLDRVTADRYVVSADGKDGNPDFETLVWLAEAIRKQGRRAQIVATNRTPSIERLVREYPPRTFGYRVRYPTAGAGWIRVPVG